MHRPLLVAVAAAALGLSGCTAQMRLGRAAGSGDLAQAELALRDGASPNAPLFGTPGVTPLSQAAAKGHLDIVKLLLDHGADINAGSPLGAAASFCHAEVASLLLDRGARVNASDTTGSSPIINSIFVGCADVAKLLLDHGADLKFDGKSDPVILAVRGGDVNLVKLVLEHGGDVNARGDDGGTALTWAAASRSGQSVARLLVGRGADVNGKDGYGDTPLIYAAMLGEGDLAHFLLDHGADPSATNAQGQTAAQVATGNNYSGIAQLIASAAIHPATPAAETPAPGLSQEDVQRIATAVAGAAQVQQEQRRQPPAEIHSDVDMPHYHAKPRPDDVALVVGVEKYSGGLPSAEYAERDAKSVRAHLLALGFPEQNIILLTNSDASRAGLVKNVERRLPELVSEDSTVFFYYSGHGAPDPATGKAYLLPFDGDPAYLEDTAYPVARLYKKLGALKAKRVLVALDSCFSGAGGRSVLARGTRPLVTKISEGKVPADVIALTASGPSQVAGALEDQGHGAFTYFLLKGLNGAAEDDQGHVTIESLYDYLKPKVQGAARRQNRDQTPRLIDVDGADVVLR